MGLRCELFGHDFGQSTIEESYDESEGGTVLTVREYKSCQRCEHIRNISENRGLISSMDESKANDERSDEAEHGDVTKCQAGQSENPKDEAEAIDTIRTAEKTEPTEKSTVTKSKTITEPSSDIGESDESSAESSSTPLEKTDDAVILSESETQEPDDDSSTPSNSDDAVIIDDTTDTADAPSETSEEPGTGNDRDGASRTAAELEKTTSDSDPTYQCPRCEFELPVSESSYFPGDVCPQCRVGYLEDTSDSESEAFEER